MSTTTTRQLEKGASPKEPIYHALLEELDASARETITNVSGAPAVTAHEEAGDDSGKDDTASEPDGRARSA